MKVVQSFLLLFACCMVFGAGAGCKPQYTITVSASPTAGGEVTGGGVYKKDAAVTVTATENAGYEFVNWTEGGTEVSASASYAFTASANRTLVANFEQESGTVYTVSVSASPDAGGEATGGGAFDEGDTVTVTATENEGYEFVNWTEGGTEVSTDSTYGFTITSNRTLVANFEETSPAGTCTDPRDGTEYKTVQIGNLTWFAENLKYESTDSFCYDDDEANCDTYGRLYLYTQETTESACPSGWHLSTEAEWTYMTYSVFSGPSVAGGKLKAVGTLEDATGLWNSPNTGATDEVGFTALPGGRRQTADVFRDINAYGYWWIAGGKYVVMSYDSSKTSTSFDYGDEAYAVRCVQDSGE